MTNVAFLRSFIAMITAIGLISSGQAHSASNLPLSGPLPSYGATEIQGKTAVDKAIGRCALAVGGGALLGALLGGDDNRAEGALVGGAVGSVICLIMLSVASKKDKAVLRETQLRALNSGRPETVRWRTTEGKSATAVVTTSNIVEVSAPKTAEVLPCRRATTQVTIADQSNETSDVVCLRGDSWVTLDELRSLGIRPDEVRV